MGGGLLIFSVITVARAHHFCPRTRGVIHEHKALSDVPRPELRIVPRVGSKPNIFKNYGVVTELKERICKVRVMKQKRIVFSLPWYLTSVSQILACNADMFPVRTHTLRTGTGRTKRPPPVAGQYPINCTDVTRGYYVPQNMQSPHLSHLL